jgi:hypothetical protein
MCSFSGGSAALVAASEDGTAAGIAREQLRCGLYAPRSQQSSQADLQGNRGREAVVRDERADYSRHGSRC